MPRYLLRLSYHGGPFRGFALNEGVPTVGGVLRTALEQVLQHTVPISCAGRTDAGVHALDQAVTFDTDRDPDPEALRTSLNGLCKPHIVVREVSQVSDSMHARFSCTRRTYLYRVLNQRLPDPFRREFTWRVSRPLDLARMSAAVAPLIGAHNFSSFCRRQFDTSGDEPVEKSRNREVLSAQWESAANDELHLTISATSFCQQMVRSITGLCVEAGLGEFDPHDTPAVLAAHDRTAVPRVAPPQGLYLLRVDY